MKSRRKAWFNEMITNLKELLLDSVFRNSIHVDEKQYSANQTICQEGDTSREVYVIRSGVVRIVGDVELEEGRNVRPGFFDLEKGEVFGELAMFDHAPRSASVVAVSDCEIDVMQGDELLNYLQNHPDIGYVILKDLVSTLVARLRKTKKKLFSLMAWGLKAHGIDEHL